MKKLELRIINNELWGSVEAVKSTTVGTQDVRIVKLTKNTFYGKNEILIRPFKLAWDS